MVESVMMGRLAVHLLVNGSAYQAGANLSRIDFGMVKGERAGVVVLLPQNT